MMTPTSRRNRWLQALRSSKKLQWAAGVALLLVVGLASEFARWHTLPEVAATGVGTGPAVGSAEAATALGAISAWAEKTRVAGLAVCVGVSGNVAWCSARGYGDIGRGEALTAETSMRLGSVSKPVTSILLARLAERNLIDLDRPIGAIKPDLPSHLHAMTLRQLASHTAGVRHYKWRFGWPPHETWSRRPYSSVTESLAAFSHDPLVFVPGSDFAYSSHGYSVLGAVLEHASATRFGELLDRELVAPLSLTATTLDSPSHAPNWSRSYEILGGRYRDALEVDNSRGWPGAGLRSSARDLAVLVSGLPDILHPQTLSTLLTPQSLPNGSANPQNYALGWRLAETQKFLGGAHHYRVAHHGGVSSGGSAFVLFFPDQALAVAVLANSRTGSGPLADLAFDVAEPFMARRVAP